MEAQVQVLNPLYSVAAHVVADALVVEQTLDGTNRTDGNVLVPQFPLSKVHDILLSNFTNGALNVLSAQAAAGGDDLATDVLSNRGGSIKGEEDGSLQLSLGPLHLSLSHIERQARPLAEREVDEVIEVGLVLADQVDTPQTTSGNVSWLGWRSKGNTWEKKKKTYPVSL